MTFAISTSSNYSFQLDQYGSVPATIDPREPCKTTTTTLRAQREINGLQKQITKLKAMSHGTKANKTKSNTYILALETEMVGKVRLIQKKLKPSEFQMVYIQKGLVGSGSFSNILKVQNSKTLKEMALKIPNKEEAYSYIISEWKALDCLKGSEHIVEKSVLFWLGKKPILLIPLYKSDLFKVLSSCGSLSLEDTATLSKQLLEALASLKEKGIVHKDIKLENIFVTEHGIKLGDFGFAVFLKEGPPQINSGTFNYFSPERLKAYKPPYGDYSSDLWAAICCITTTYTGKDLFSGKNTFDIIRLQQARLREKQNQSTIRNIPVNTRRSSLDELIEREARLKSENHIIDPLKDFLKTSLALDPTKRLSLEQSLEHPFIQGGKKRMDLTSIVALKN